VNLTFEVATKDTYPSQLNKKEPDKLSTIDGLANKSNFSMLNRSTA